MRKNVFRNIDFLIFPIQCIPIQTLFALLYTILNALMPAYETIALANFLNCAIDIFEGNRTGHEIVKPIMMICVYILFVNVMPTVSNIIMLTGTNRMTLQLKGLLLDKKASLEYAHIENTETRELIERVCLEPVENFQSGFNNILSALNIIISSSSLVLLIMNSAFLSGIVIVLVSIPLFVIALKVGKNNYEMSKEAKNIQRRYKYLADVLVNREFVNERNLFNYSKYLRNDYSFLYKKSFVVESKIEKRTYANMKSGSIVTLLIILVIVSVLLPSLNSGKISIGLFVALVNAIFGLVQAMSWQLSGTMREYSRLKEYLNELNIFMSLSEKKDACVKKAKDTQHFTFNSLEFRNVSFKYPGTEHYVLKNCSFVLKAGKSYSFVGANGAGKSTITKLIVGMYNDYDGVILLNNLDIKEYDYATLKAIIAVLFQDFTSYEMTLKENIILSRDMCVDNEDLMSVISNVGLNGLIADLKKSIETPLGKIQENGVDISGGQWQRVAIARLLYSEAKINILDEPTASLDPVAESKLYKMFHRINADRFNIYITHRLGAAKISDVILVVSEGRIAEWGSHSQLMKIENGIYRNMYESQKAWYM